MKVKEFFEMFGASISMQRFEIYLNKEFICCGYIECVRHSIHRHTISQDVF